MLLLEKQIEQILADTSLEVPRPLAMPEFAQADAERLLGIHLASLSPAAVLIPIIRRGDRLHVMFNVRSQQLRHHPGQISFPGGRRDPEDADAVANALREASEETGLDPAAVTVVGYLDDFPTISGFRVTPVVGFVNETAQFCVDGIEAVELFEVPLAFLLATNHYRTGQLARKGADLTYYEVPYEGRNIWGATAGMLYELACRYANRTHSCSNASGQ